MTAFHAEPRFIAPSNQASTDNNSKCLFTKPPLRMWGQNSNILCYLKKCPAKELIKGWCFKRPCFKRAVGTVLFPGANTCSVVPFLGEGSEHGSLGWNAWRYGSLQHCEG